MKIKNVLIQIKPFNDFLKDAKKNIEKSKKGEKVDSPRTIVFTEIDQFRKFLTMKRLEILKIIKKHKPKSMYEIAKLTKRDFKNVANDLKLLEELGFIELEKTKEGDSFKLQPHLSYDQLNVSIPL